MLRPLLRTEAGLPILQLQSQLKKGRGRESRDWCNTNTDTNTNTYTYTYGSIGASTPGRPRAMSGEDDIAATPASSEKEDVVVQYVVVRRDLIDTWPLGSVITQGCHASVAAIWQFKDDPSTLAYCSPPPALLSMHKASTLLLPLPLPPSHHSHSHSHSLLCFALLTQVTLEVKGHPQLLNLSHKLNSSGILHTLWIEQPENIPTCLATKPYPKSLLSPFFRKLKLCN